ncbi:MULTISPECIES: hypothetical protein [Empedobacter]|mgnify:CR=1 FL=1|uniref:hypothetical protein n=1 Tax=Empedobacter TaxID=59734 RepID=UPI002574DA95|nr:MULTISPECIES: hypothetical protein [Empedobacter]MDM1040811.1 hypothetical protein [Empedobacter brevis]MDM1134392.1 hypothetical protein [Empedobacter sp. R750]
MKLKNLLFLSAISCSFLTTYSCNDDNSSSSLNENQNVKQSKISFDSGKKLLKFSGRKNDIKIFIEDTISKEKIFNKYYDQGFIPLSISPDIKDEGVINKMSNLILSNKSTLMNKSSDDTSDETFLEDEDFASILNDKGAVQLNDSIYMYTPNGLFIVHQDDYDELEYYIEKNQNISIPSGLNQVTDNITSYRPDLATLGTEYEIIAPIDPEDGGGGGGGTYNPSPTIPSKGETNHYKNCNNGISNPFLGNIFGKQYVCEYFFDGDHQVKTVFEIQDFLLFYSVRAKNKYRRKGTFGWRTDDARKLYLKINDGLIKVERKTFTATFNNSQIQPIIKAINDLITVKSSFVPVVTSEFLLNSSGNYTQTDYSLATGDLGYYNTTGMLIFPQNKQISSSVNMDSFKSLLNTSKKSIIYINIFNKDREITHEQILKVAADAFKKYATAGRTPSDIAIVMNEIKASQDRIDAQPLYIVTKDELIEANNTHKVLKDFDIRKDFDLKEFIVGFKTNENGDKKFEVKFKLGFNKITQYKMDIEGGVYYNNRWGGTKFIVQKN